jgi:hypothetical protein
MEIPQFIQKYGQMTAEELAGGQHHHSIVGVHSSFLLVMIFRPDSED